MLEFLHYFLEIFYSLMHKNDLNYFTAYNKI